MFTGLVRGIGRFFARDISATTVIVNVDEDQEVHVHNHNVEEVIRLQNRERELLQHNNYMLEMYRAEKAEVKELRAIIGEMDNLLVKHSEVTGYCGCDLEKRAVLAGSDIRDE